MCDLITIVSSICTLSLSLYVYVCVCVFVAVKLRLTWKTEGNYVNSSSMVSSGYFYLTCGNEDNNLIIQI